MKPSKGFDSLGNPIKETVQPVVPHAPTPQVVESPQLLTPFEYLIALQKLRTEKGEEAYKAAWNKLDRDTQLLLLRMLGKEPTVTESEVKEIVRVEIQEQKQKALKIYAYLMIGILVASALVGLWFYATYAGPRSYSTGGSGSNPSGLAGCPSGYHNVNPNPGLATCVPNVPMNSDGDLK